MPGNAGEGAAMDARDEELAEAVAGLLKGPRGAQVEAVVCEWGGRGERAGAA